MSFSIYYSTRHNQCCSAQRHQTSPCGVFSVSKTQCEILDPKLNGLGTDVVTLPTCQFPIELLHRTTRLPSPCLIPSRQLSGKNFTKMSVAACCIHFCFPFFFQIESRRQVPSCSSDYSVCTSILKISSANYIEEGPLCTCAGCQLESTWTENDDQSITWYHHERGS